MVWTPKRKFDEIRQMTFDLQRRRTSVVQKMLEISLYYDADYVIPLPDVADEPNMPKLTPSLMTDVVDNLSMRAASVRPMLFSPAKDQYGPDSVRYAADRVRIINATYAQSGWILQRRRAIRHQTAYNTSSLFIQPDFKAKMPMLRVRNPLETYPEERSMEDMRPPEHTAFITRYSGAFLRATYPQVSDDYGGPISSQDQTQLWDVLEWVDCDQIVYGLLGPVQALGDHVVDGYTNQWGGPWMPLTDPVQNKAGVCLGLSPGSVTLHRIGNHLNRLIGMIDWQQKLMALEVVAAEKAVFPDMYAISNSQTGAAPSLSDGTWHDGRSGEMNLVANADSIGLLNQSPDARTAQLEDRLEQAFRMSSGLAPQMQGVTHGAALRTGRALGEMASMSIDPRIQELHEIDEVWMPHVNEAILASYEGWWPTKKYTMFSRWPGDVGQLEFTPNECIEGIHDTSVEYAISGADITQVTQVIGSLVGADLIAPETAQRMHPMIRDPLGEQQRIEEDKLNRIQLEALHQQVTTGQMPMETFARIKTMYEQGEYSLTECIVEIDKQVREEQLRAQQAAMAQQQPEPGLSSVMGLGAGPAAAAPGAVPGAGMPSPAQAPAAVGPVASMRQMLQGANPLAGG